MASEKYGLLVTPDIKLHRQYFREMCKLHGIWALYRAPKKDKHYTTYAEIISNYEEPIKVGCIFDQHPDMKTMKKLGWVTELQENSSFIHVDYDLPGLQQGALFYIPTGLDDEDYKMFRVVNLSASLVYPASVSCEIVPEWKNTFTPEQAFDYSNTSFNLLSREDEDEVEYEER